MAARKPPASVPRRAGMKNALPATSKTKLLALVRALDWKAVSLAVSRHPDLLDYRGKRGENYLHVCCSIDIAKHRQTAANSIKTADALIDAGLAVDREAFREGAWKATPLWYAIGRGHNLELAKRLLERGSTPEHCLWAAAYHDDPKAIRMLVQAGATVDATHDGETPLLFAVKWSRFAAAAALLECGADPNVRDDSGNTPMRIMMKKRSDASHVRMFLEHGARPEES